MIEKSWSCMPLSMVPEQVWDWHCCSYCFLGFFFIIIFIFIFIGFLGPLFSVLSFLLWNSLWLVEEVLTSLCLFLIVRMEISQFSWEIILYEWSSFRSKLGGRQIKVNHAWGKFFFIWLSRSKGRNMEVLQWNIGIHLLKHTSQVYFPHLP